MATETGELATKQDLDALEAKLDLLALQMASAKDISAIHARFDAMDEKMDRLMTLIASRP